MWLVIKRIYNAMYLIVQYFAVTVQAIKEMKYRDQQISSCLKERERERQKNISPECSLEIPMTLHLITTPPP